jgi:hypothetical protein
MQRIPQIELTGNSLFNQTRQRAQSHNRKTLTLTANMHTSKAAQGYVVAVLLYSNNRRIAHSLLQAKDCANAERAWLAGYNEAQRLADEHAPDARLFVQDSSATGRRAA